jgi:hypothetical protein
MEEEENQENNFQNNNINNMNNDNNNENNNEMNNNNNNINNQEMEGSQEEENMEDNDDNKLMYIYEWVDSIPLSRQKKNISRDFNDAVLLAEMIKYHYPRLVDLHNYPSASSTKAKLVNWETLNKKVLKKLGVKVNKAEITDIINSKPNAIENLLGRLYHVIHGIPQENPNPNPKKNDNFGQNSNNVLRNNKLMNNNQMMDNDNMMMNNEENNELINAINEKDQEIANLKGFIEDLEQKLKNSNEKQNQLELKIKELTSLLLQ